MIRKRVYFSVFTNSWDWGFLGWNELRVNFKNTYKTHVVSTIWCAYYIFDVRSNAFCPRNPVSWGLMKCDVWNCAICFTVAGLENKEEKMNWNNVRFKTNIHVNTLCTTVTNCPIRTACLYQGEFSSLVRQMYTTSSINSRILLQMTNLFTSLVIQQLKIQAQVLYVTPKCYGALLKIRAENTTQVHRTKLVKTYWGDIWLWINVFEVKVIYSLNSAIEKILKRVWMYINFRTNLGSHPTSARLYCFITSGDECLTKLFSCTELAAKKTCQIWKAMDTVHLLHHMSFRTTKRKYNFHGQYQFDICFLSNYKAKIMLHKIFQLSLMLYVWKHVNMMNKRFCHKVLAMATSCQDLQLQCMWF